MFGELLGVRGLRMRGPILSLVGVVRRVEARLRETWAARSEMLLLLLVQLLLELFCSCRWVILGN